MPNFLLERNQRRAGIILVPPLRRRRASSPRAAECRRRSAAIAVEHPLHFGGCLVSLRRCGPLSRDETPALHRRFLSCARRAPPPRPALGWWRIRAFGTSSRKPLGDRSGEVAPVSSLTIDASCGSHGDEQRKACAELKNGGARQPARSAEIADRELKLQACRGRGALRASKSPATPRADEHGEHQQQAAAEIERELPLVRHELPRSRAQRRHPRARS